MSEVDKSALRERLADVRSHLGGLPRQRFAHLPTPLERLPRLSARLGGPEIWIKRDDCTGLAFGGNKARQLEFVLGDAVASGADVVIQGAAAQSNHSRQLAAAAARVGLDSVILPRRDKFYARGGGNQLVTRLLATRLEPVDADASVSAAKEALAEELRAQGRRPYVVGMGAERALSLAAVAYVEAFCEIVDALLAGGEPMPTCIYTTSQGSTQAGLQLGAALLGLAVQVTGINPMTASNEAYISAAGIESLIVQAAEILRFDDVSCGPITNIDHYVGPGYGIPSDESNAAIALLAGTEGILVDPIYSGKGLSGMLDHIRRGSLTRSDRVVFVHTGGLPALFADFAER